MDQADTSAPAVLPDELSWGFNPWQANWRRPALALSICIVMAILGGYAFNKPPKHLTPEMLQDNQPAAELAAEQAATPPASQPADQAADEAEQVAAEQTKPRLGQGMKEAREQLPWQVHWFWWSLAGFLMLFGMTAPVYIPAQYKLNQEGIAVRFLGRRSFRKWSHYRNYYAHLNGVHVTTLSTPSRLDPFRGHFLQFTCPDAEGQTNRAEVLAFIKAHMKLKGKAEAEVPR